MPDGRAGPRTPPLDPAAPGATSLVGLLVAGRYQVRALIGEGGNGAVYEVEHVPSGRPLALKTLLAGGGGAADIARRFEREAKAQSLLDHPHIVEVLDLGLLQDGALYLVMELVRGRSVGELLDAGAIGPRRALVIARQTLEALEHAHARGLVHRDLKPDNIMVTQAGEPGLEHDHVKLLDFGLVKLVGDAAADVGGDRLTRTGVVFGTPAYMAPEQALGRAVDGRADLYSLGVALFEMLTGARPFSSHDPYQLLRMHVSQPCPALAAVAPGAPWATPAMEALVARALQKRPEERYRDAREMTAALDEAFLSIDHLPAAPDDRQGDAP